MEDNKLTRVQARMDEINAEMDKLKRELWTLVEDKSIPLDDRWQLFLDYDMGKKECYIVHWKTLGNYTLEGEKKDKYSRGNREFENKFMGYDWYERHQTVEVESLYERLQEQFEESEETVAERLEEDSDQPEDELYDDTIFAYVDDRGINFGEHSIDEWREEVISRGISSFEYDW